jgi:hypothetical protein
MNGDRALDGDHVMDVMEDGDHGARTQLLSSI